MTLAWLTLVVTLAGTVLADVVDGRIGWTPSRTKRVQTLTPLIAVSVLKKKQKKMIKTSKIKILRDVVMLLHLLVRKIKKLKFGHVLQKNVMKK